MKNNFIITILFIFGCSINTEIYAQADSSFSYQGQLMDSGIPASDSYDFTVEGLDGLGSTIGTIDTHLDVSVVNGLFNLDVDLGVAYFDGYEDYYLEVSIRKTSVGGAYTTLGSLQTIQAVPLATNLINGNATAGQVLTFNGFQWNPALPASSSTLWTTSGSDISYTSGYVGIGEADPNISLSVKSTEGFTANFDGGDNMYVYFEENGNGRGYIGSFQDPADSGILDEDFEIGTTGGSLGSMHIVTGDNNPRITATAEGNIGINSTTPSSDLFIEGTTDGDLLRVRVNTTTKFYIDENGGSSVGSYNTPPSNGLRVQGDVKQPMVSNGMMKYMVYVTGCGSNTPVISRSYNGVSTGSITVADDAEAGECVIDFPDDINTRYWQVTALGNGGYGAQCTQGLGNGIDKLSCHRFVTSTGTGSNGSIMVLIY